MDTNKCLLYRLPYQCSGPPVIFGDVILPKNHVLGFSHGRGTKSCNYCTLAWPLPADFANFYV